MFEKVGFRKEVIFISGETDVADAGLWEDGEHGICHAEAGAHDGNEGDGVGQMVTYAWSQRGVDLVF